MKIIIYILLFLMLTISTAGATVVELQNRTVNYEFIEYEKVNLPRATVVELQNRTVNMNYGFNEYVKINTTEPFNCFQFFINYNHDELKLNYFSRGDMFQYTPAGKWLSYEGGKPGNYYGAMMAEGNRSKPLTTYGTFNFRALKRGNIHLNLTGISMCYADGSFSKYWNSTEYTVKVV